MINTSISKQLDILLPNTNKALSEALKSASPKELQSLSSFKDLKSMMGDILKQSTNPNSSNKVLLELVKNNPTLKNLGSVSTTIKDLLNSIKSDKNPLPIEKTLQNILADIKDLKGVELKEKFIKPTLSLEQNLKDNSTIEKTIKSFLTDIKDLKGSELKEKLTSLKTFLETNLKNSNNSSSTLKSIVSNDLKTLLLPTKEKESLPIEKVLKNFLIDIKDLKGSELKQKFINSGVFLEANIKNAKDTPESIKSIVSNDLKAILHKASEDISKSSHPNQSEVLKHIDKLSLQIDNYQLVSYLSNGSSLYLPFSWDQLEDGNIEVKKAKNDKFFCDINLKLKEYGEINLKLALYDENQLNIHIYSTNKEFKELVQQNIPSLRSALIDIKITPREIRLFEPKSKIQNSPYGTIDDNLQMGFEIKV
ncbi:MAG: flagellar hook-length control protein FliK [Campylobacterota bacterium]|nr:flagellar hook-length control protein FliK [Campylobacterota bacterium]